MSEKNEKLLQKEISTVRKCPIFHFCKKSALQNFFKITVHFLSLMPKLVIQKSRGNWLSFLVISAES